MRRPLFMLPATTALAALAALTALGALGCEDGPAQTFSAAPPNAGNIWNNGNVAPDVADAGQAFDASYPTVDKTVLCSTDFKRQRWAWMLTQPIWPPRWYAGIDLAAGDQWPGLTIEAAEAPPSSPTADAGGLCQSVPQGFEGICPSGFGDCNGSYWGNNGEVSFSWNVSTHILDQMVINLGYTGVLATNAYPDHNGESHTWSLAIGDVVRRDGLPFEMNWNNSTDVNQQITDIFNGIMSTYALSAGVPFNTAACTTDTTCQAQAPGTISNCQCTKNAQGSCDTTIPGNDGKCGITNCASDGNCLVYNAGGTTIFGIRPMVVYIEGASGVPQPALSTPTLIYNFFSKWEPFSYLPQSIKLDAEGPVALGTPIGAATGATCKQLNGQTFADFTTNCVQVQDPTNPTPVDVTNLNKVTHGLIHDQEHWTANVLGVNQNFTSLKVAQNPNIVVLDTDTPQPGDLAQDWTFDVRARGAVANDYVADPGGDYHVAGPALSLAGSALVMIEWSRLLLADIANILGKEPSFLGDPRCTGFTNGTPNYKLNPQVACSGIEGMIIPNAVASYGPGNATTDFSGDFVTLPNSPPGGYPGINQDFIGIYSSILKPGDNFGAFCIDPGPGQETDCDENSGFSLFQNALQHVTRVLGDGVQTNMPAELQDRRYYFKWFGIAYIKYLKAYGNFAAAHPGVPGNVPVNQFPVAGMQYSGLAPSDVDAQQIDLESLFFDYQGGAGGTFDKFEYIDRDFIGQGTGGTYNYIPWDFEYGCDLFGGNQRYDNWYRRMDREEIAMFASMLVNKNDTAGQENNVNITNLFGSEVLGGIPASAVPGTWPSYACAIGQAGDPAQNCVNTGFIDTEFNNYLYTNAPLDVTNPSGAPPCDFGTYPATGCASKAQSCAIGHSFESGQVQVCGDLCDFSATSPNPLTGCASPTQTCVAGSAAFGLPEACADMKMDKNGPNATTPHPELFYYPGAWTQTPFSRGHSPITLAQADKEPFFGVAKPTIPNFANGPYTNSPIAAAASAPLCPTGYTVSANNQWCNAALNTGTTGNTVPSFKPLFPWMEVQPAVGFSIPLDAQHSQWVSTGQMDFTGVLETYIVDYVPYVDANKPSCVADSKCNTGYTCVTEAAPVAGAATNSCVTDDNTISISAIEGADFLGQAFVCMDPTTFDVLHVGMYDSAVSILDWFAAHPGTSNGWGQEPSAQTACQVLVIRSPYNNYVDYIVSKQYGVALNMSGGQGQGRVTDIVLFDPGLIQAL